MAEVPKDAAKEVAAPAAAAQPAAASAASSGSKSGGSSIGQRITAFCIGLAVAGTAGYFSLNTQVWESAVQVREAVTALRTDVVEDSLATRKRLSELEKRLEALEKK